MKPGAENRKKTVMLGVLGAVALSGILYNLFAVFGGSGAPPPTVAPLSNAPAPVKNPTNAGRPGTASSTVNNGPGAPVAMAGVNAQKLATAAASLDPTLDQAAMLRTESLVYSGSGRNIFSATYTAPAPAIPKNVPPPRPGLGGPSRLGPVLSPAGPPPPTIPLKFFGTVQHGHGPKQVFLLSGEDVYLASQGDVVDKRYKVVQIMAFGVQVTDLVLNVTQTLPMQQQ